MILRQSGADRLPLSLRGLLIERTNDYDKLLPAKKDVMFKK